MSQRTWIFFLEYRIKGAGNIDSFKLRTKQQRWRVAVKVGNPARWSMRCWYQSCPTQSLGVCKNKLNNASDEHSPKQEEEEVIERWRTSLQSTNADVVVSFQGKTNPTLNCESIKVYRIWHSPSHQLRLWVAEDDVALTESVLVTKMKLLKGVVSCAVFLSLSNFRLEVFQICEWLRQKRSMRPADHGGEIYIYIHTYIYIYTYIYILIFTRWKRNKCGNEIAGRQRNTWGSNMYRIIKQVFVTQARLKLFKWTPIEKLLQQVPLPWGYIAWRDISGYWVSSCVCMLID
jgi:hypothetical protein